MTKTTCDGCGSPGVSINDLQVLAFGFKVNDLCTECGQVVLQKIRETVFALRVKNGLSKPPEKR